MNYKKQYERLITRAQNRVLEGYSEKHHILPRCLGGTDEEDNLARLTAREHFTAHVLLVKMWPEERGLIYAVNAMCRFRKKQDRSKNRMYGWLKEIYAKEVSIRQSAEGNSQFGTCWISDVENEVSKKIKKEELQRYLDGGWVKGRNKKKRICQGCDIQFYRKGASNFHTEECRVNYSKINNHQLDKFNDKIDEMVLLCEEGECITNALKKAGFCGSGKAFGRLKQIMENRPTVKPLDSESSV